MRLTVPGDLPSTRISCGWTTVASATAGFVTAIRVISRSVLITVERPAVRFTRSAGGIAGCAGAGGGAACVAGGRGATGTGAWAPAELERLTIPPIQSRVNAVPRPREA